MKHWLLGIALICFGSSARAAVSGHLDLQTPLAYSAWQSVESTDQALGFSKRVYHVDKDAQEVVRLGLFGGASKNLFDPSKPAKAVGGLTLAVPGSLLDFLLGTKMGDKWIPALKTGILGAYDLTRIKQLHYRPNFIGVGIAYPVGG